MAKTTDKTHEDDAMWTCQGCGSNMLAWQQGSHVCPSVIDALASVFESEWETLSATDKALIVRDCTEPTLIDDVTEYQRNIGAGNLQRYALTQRIRFGGK